MLYTESMEMASPLLARELPEQASQKVGLSETIKNRLAHPRLDLGLCMGSEAFVVCTATGSVVHPARVATYEKNHKVVALGAGAEEIEGREPEGVVVNRPIHSGVVADPLLASKLMARVIASTKHGLLSPPRVALAVPAGLTAVESQTLLATAKRAGARSVYLVDQALAAAIGAGRDLSKAEGHLVVHLGAGVSQVTVASLASPVISRGLRIAGDSMTEAIAEHIRREHNLLVDHKVAQSVKHQLGSALPPIGDKSVAIVGRELGVGKPVEKSVSAAEIYEVLRPFLAEIAQEARWVVAQMSTELLGDVHRNGVILSGGTAELSHLDEFLSEQLRLRVYRPREPQTVVARGLQRLLKDHLLRKAVFHKGHQEYKTRPLEEKRGTGLLGALLLTSALAFSVSSAPQLQQGAATGLDHYLSGLVTPSSPISEGWGWHNPDLALTTELEEKRRNQLEQENDRLRTLLKAPHSAGKSTKLESVLADVVARDPRGWMSTLTLNAGSEQGVHKGMTVSDGRNLVGQVSTVQKNRCQVRLFTDAKAVVGGVLHGKKASGVVVGSGQHEVEMRYLDPDAGVKKGDEIFTSGQDGIFPAGICIGKVTKVYQPSQANYLAAVITPSVDLGKLENVVVIKR